MAVKAIAVVVGADLQSDMTYAPRVDIMTASNNVSGVAIDTYFGPTALPSTVNTAIREFIEAYIQSQWSVEFNPVTDSVKLINPISLL